MFYYKTQVSFYVSAASFKIIIDQYNKRVVGIKTFPAVINQISFGTCQHLSTPVIC